MPAEKNAVGPLDGIVVVDLSRVLAGPWTTQLLGDYGASIIKVERPGSGDDTRQWGPPWLRDSDGDRTPDSAYFLSTNRNKRSICVDIGKAQGADVVRLLAQQADVVIENFRTGTAERFGVDYARLRTDNPGLVYCSISAFGRTGSRAGLPGYDAMVQASAGLMSITGEPDERGGSPQKVGVAVSDIMAGMYAATAILAALVERQSSGEGQFIDVPLYDSQVAWLANQNMNYLIGGEVPGRMGTGHPNLVPYRTFATTDGYLTLAIGNDRQFAACAGCIGLPELVNDSRYRTNSDRVSNRTSLEKILEDQFRTKSTCDWLTSLAAAGVPAGPVNTIADVFDDDYAAEKQLIRHLEHPAAGSVPTVANPVYFSRSSVTYKNSPPTLGQHTYEILSARLGFSDEKIAELARNNVI